MTDSSFPKPAQESPFWRFSLGFYALPGVAPACLVLQDEGGIDVNVMLFLLFLAKNGKTVRREEVARIDDAVAPWRKDVVAPLRAVRRALKRSLGAVPLETGESLRHLVKKVELESERLEQGVLESLAGNLATGVAAPADAAAANLAAYASHIGTLPEKPLQIVLRAFTDALP